MSATQSKRIIKVILGEPGPSTWRDRSVPVQNGIHTRDIRTPVPDEGGRAARAALAQYEQFKKEIKCTDSN